MSVRQGRREGPRSRTADDGVAITPLTIFGSSVELWLRADLGITLNGGNVSAWADQSGKGRHFVQVVAGRQVPYAVSGLNGKPCLSHDGATSVYVERADDFQTMFPVANHALYMVLQPQNLELDTNSWNEPAAITDTAGNQTMVTSTAGALHSYHWDGAEKVADIAAVAGTNYRVRRRFSGSTIYINLNGGADATVAAGAPVGVGAGTIIGTNYDTSKKFKGLIGEVIGVGRDITPAEDAAIQAYLANFWGF